MVGYLEICLLAAQEFLKGSQRIVHNIARKYLDSDEPSFLHPLLCNPCVFSDLIGASAKWDAYVAVDAPVWRVSLVAVVLLVRTYAVAEAIGRLIPMWGLTRRSLTAQLTQRWFLQLEAYPVTQEMPYHILITVLLVQPTPTGR